MPKKIHEYIPAERWMWNDKCCCMTCEQLNAYEVDNGPTKDYVFIKSETGNKQFTTRISEKKIGTVLMTGSIYFLGVGNKDKAYLLFTQSYHSKFSELVSKANDVRNQLQALYDAYNSDDTFVYM